jgi:hypothetical protein
MPDLEDQLRAALQRREPPSGFAERVLGRAGPPPRKALPVWASPWKRFSTAAVAAALIVMLLSAVTYQHMREERVARQAELALRIASEKLNLARDGVFRNTGDKDY